MSKRMTQIQYLPDDLIGEILLRLPVKSIGRFKCVSKSWQSLLSSSQLVQQYQDYHQNPDHVVFFVNDYQYPYLLTTRNDNEQVLKEVHFDHLDPDRRSFIAGSCHGLVLIMQDFGDFRGLLANPVTSEAIPIPKIGLDSDKNHMNDCMHGLGYDSSEKDFKIVSISRFLRTGPRNHVSIYSLETNTWRSLKNSEYEHHNVVNGVFVNGRLHWVSLTKGKKKACVIAAFNLATEEFETVPFFRGFEGSKGLEKDLVVVGGCLAMVSSANPDDVWLMKSYGNEDSWTKFRIHFPAKLRQFHVVCFLNEDEVVLVEDKERVVAYDWRNRVEREIGGINSPYCISNRGITSFKGSPISLPIKKCNVKVI